MISRDAFKSVSLPQTKKKSLAGKTAWNVVAGSLKLTGRLAAGIIIARSLGPGGAGRIAYLVWMVDTVNILTNLGLQNSLTRFLAEFGGHRSEQETRGLAVWLYRRYLLLALVGAVAIGIISKTYASPVGSQNLWILLALMFLTRGLAVIYQAFLRGRQRFGLLARINAYSIIGLVTGMGAGVYFFGIPGALGGYIIGSLVPAVCSLSILRGCHNTNLLDLALCRRVWKYALFTWLAAIVSAFVWSRMEIFFIELYWDDHEVAMFSVGIALSMLITQAAMIFSGAFLPHFAELAGKNDPKRIAATYVTGTRLLALVLFPMAFGGAAIMPVLLPMMYGSEFTPAVPNAMVLVAGSCLMFSTVASSLVYGLERSIFIVFSGLAGAVFVLAAGLLIIPTWGAWGAAWSRTAVQTCMVALGMWYISTRLNCPVPLAELLRTLLAAVLCGLATWWVVRIGNNPIILALAIPVGVFVYLCAVRILAVLSPQDALHIDRALAKLPKRINCRMSMVLKWIGRIK